MTYSWKKLECEVCKEPLPKTVILDGKEYPIVPIQKP